MMIASTEYDGYEYYQEIEIMDDLKLRYSDKDSKLKSSIARMVIQRRQEIAKVIEKRAERTHHKKITAKQSVIEHNATKRKSRLQSFQMNGRWYTKEGVVFNPETQSSKKEDLSNFYLTRIKHIEGKLLT